VLRESSIASRFEAFHASALTPLVGREEEIELLLRRWARAKTGEGQVVLLSGEPGIGKSRIAATALEKLQGEPHTRLRYFCSPHHHASALHPFISQLERAAGFERDDAPERKLDKLEGLRAPASRMLRGTRPSWPSCYPSRAGAATRGSNSVHNSERSRPSLHCWRNSMGLRRACRIVIAICCEVRSKDSTRQSVNP
jgi:hypothetical protein